MTSENSIFQVLVPVLIVFTRQLLIIAKYAAVVFPRVLVPVIPHCARGSVVVGSTEVTHHARWIEYNKVKKA